jgi:hypothetical protein
MFLEKQQKFNVNIRPIKHAYFVKDGDELALEQVIHLAGTQWGGIRSLIIPVNADYTIDDIFSYYLRFHEPDKFINFVATDVESSSAIKANMEKFFTQRRIFVEYGKFYLENDLTSHILDCIPQQEERPFFNLEKILPGDTRLRNLVLFGEIFPGQEDEYSGKFMLLGGTSDPEKIQFFRSQFNGKMFSSIVNLTSYGIKTKTASGGFFRWACFDLILHESFKSLLLYWNQRAVREASSFWPDSGSDRRVILLPASTLENKELCAELFDGILKKINAGEGHPSDNTNFHVNFLSLSADGSKKLREMATNQEILTKFQGKLSIKFPPAREKVDKLSYLLNYTPIDMVSYQEGVSREPPQLYVLEYGNNEIRFSPPSNFINRRSGGVTVDFESEVWGRYPRTSKVSDLFNKDSWFTEYGLTSLRTISQSPQFLSFNLPPAKDVVFSAIGDKGYGARLTKINQYSHAVIDLLGGLQKAELFANAGVLEILDALALKSTKKLAQRISEIANIGKIHANEIEKVLGDFELPEELKGIPKNLDQLCEKSKLPKNKVLKLLETMSQLGVVVRGYYISCPNCGAFDWFPLGAVDNKVDCGGCSHNFSLPIAEERDREIRWKYRLNSLINRAFDQDILPGIIAAAKIHRDMLFSEIFFGLELLKDDMVLTDMDFVFVNKQKFYGGECKNSTRLTEKDVRTADLGFLEFYFVSIKEFEAPSLAMINEMREKLSTSGKKMEIKILTSKDLLQ